MVRKNARVVALLGLPICNVSKAQTVASIDGRIRSGGRYQIATANLDFVRNARKDPELHRVICECAMVLPDGYPLVWVSKMLGRPLKARLTGADLTPELAKLSAAKGYGIFLLGSSDENARKTAAILTEQYPGANFVGHYSPPVVPLEQMDDDEILRRVHEAKPDILLVAFGNPKQELWVYRNRHRLHVPISIGVGGTLDLIAGQKRRAPLWLQSIGGEWIWRMYLEPGRLGPRYFNDFIALLRYLPGELLAARQQGKREVGGGFRIDAQQGHRVLHVHNALTGDLCPSLRDAVRTAISNDCDVTIDLSAATQVGADGVGCLLDIRRSLLANGKKLYLLEAPEAIQRVLTNAALRPLFATEPEPRHSVLPIDTLSPVALS